MTPSNSIKTQTVPAASQNPGEKTIWVLGENLADCPNLSTTLVSKGYQPCFTTTEALLDNHTLPQPDAVIIDYNWSNDIGLRAYLLNHQNLQQLPVIFSGAKSPRYPASALQVVGHCTNPDELPGMIDLLDHYFAA